MSVSIADILARVEGLLGAKVESHRVAQGGYTPATRLVCQTSKGSFFAKAGSTPLTAGVVRREAAAYDVLTGPFVPHRVAWEDDDAAPLLIIEDLSHAHWPPPWDTSHVDRALAQVEAMHAMTTSLDTFGQVIGLLDSGWRMVADDPEPFLSLGFADASWLDAALPTLIECEDACPTEGEALTHFDLRSDNMCFTRDRTLFIDWNHACKGSAELDLGFWLPSLAYEGGPEPDIVLSDAPQVAAKVAGYFASRASMAGIPNAPRVRALQREQLVASLPWAVRAMQLPPLPVPRRG